MTRRFTTLVFAVASACGCAEHKPEPTASGSAAVARSAPGLVVVGPAAPAPPDASPLEAHCIDVGSRDCRWIKTRDGAVPGNGRNEGLNIVIEGGDWGGFGRVDGDTFASEYLLSAQVLHSSRTILDKDVNNTPVVLRIGFSSPALPISFPFIGNAEDAVEEKLTQQPGDGLRRSVLKAGREGSKSSTTEGFLRQSTSSASTSTTAHKVHQPTRGTDHAQEK